MAKPYGYWTFGSKKNALVGAPTVVVTQDDGTEKWVKDPDLPAVLQDEFIINAIMTSTVARTQFNILFPQLDVRSKERLTDLLARFPVARKKLNNPWFNQSPQDLEDAIQHKEVTAGVHPNLPTKESGKQ